ncbi:22757_t:CDS:1, partial [Racocetra persica]
VVQSGPCWNCKEGIKQVLEVQEFVVLGLVVLHVIISEARSSFQLAFRNLFIDSKFFSTRMKILPGCVCLGDVFFDLMYNVADDWAD